MSCMEEVRVTVLVNEKGDGFFRPTRGLRQGCPLSPYLSIIAMKFLFKRITEARLEGRLTGVQLTPRTPILTQTMYSDDLVLFGEAAGLKVNSIKSTICISREAAFNTRHVPPELGFEGEFEQIHDMY
jgi:Reverse transcriptase (RNA-dependent DNA polymerase)